MLNAFSSIVASPILASASSAAHSAAKFSLDDLGIHVPTHWPGQVDVLTWCEQMGPGMAAILLMAGIIYLLFGYYMFRSLVCVNAALMAAVGGTIIGEKLGSSVGGAIVAGVAAIAVTWLMMKWAVAVMGGLYGAILGAFIWRGFGLESHYMWAGALSGLIMFGMLSFILFRGSVMMYTSLQGSVMLIFGLLGLLYKYQEIAPGLTSGITIKPFILPTCIFVPTVVGLLFQQANFPPPAPAKKAG